MPLINNSINNNSQNTFLINPSFPASTKTTALSVAPTMTQPSGGPYYGISDTAAFNFTGTATTAITAAYGTYLVPSFTPSSTVGTLTLTNAYGTYVAPTFVPGAGGVITNAYSIYATTPSGASNNYTAILGATNTALVGIGTATPTTALTVNGGQSGSVTTTGASYTALSTDYIIEVTNTASPRTINLPTASASNRGQQYRIKDTSGGAGTNNIIIAPNTGTIDGSASILIATNYGWASVYSDGSAWYSNSAASSTPFSWVAVIGTSQTISGNQGYYTQNAATTTLTLPLTMAAGQYFEITGVGSGLWVIAQLASQSIVFGNTTSTVGAGGSLSATAVGDSIRVLCTVANTTFQVISAVGNISVG